MKKGFVALALCALISTVATQAAVVYEFNSNLTDSIFIYSDFLFQNLQGLYPTLLSSSCVTKDASHPCQGVGVLGVAEGNGCVDNIASCLKAYSFSEYDPETDSIVAYRSTYRGASGHGLFVPLEVADSRDFGTTGSPAYLFIYDLSPVPEPSTWVMLIAGFGAAGAFLRYRKVRLPAATHL